MAAGGKEGRSIVDLDTVRSLHKTVIALRTALERSKAELESVRKTCGGAMDDKNKVVNRLVFIEIRYIGQGKRNNVNFQVPLHIHVFSNIYFIMNPRVSVLNPIVLHAFQYMYLFIYFNYDLGFVSKFRRNGRDRVNIYN